MFKTLDVGNRVIPTEGKGKRLALRLPQMTAWRFQAAAQTGLGGPPELRGLSWESWETKAERGLQDTAAEEREPYREGGPRTPEDDPPWVFGSVLVSTRVKERLTSIERPTREVRENRPRCSHMVRIACYHQLDQKPSPFTGPWRECTEGSWLSHGEALSFNWAQGNDLSFRPKKLEKGEEITPKVSRRKTGNKNQSGNRWRRNRWYGGENPWNQRSVFEITNKIDNL